MEKPVERTKKRTKRAVYATDAERARAWRQRQKELIAAASQPTEPIVVEKVVEKIVELIVEKPVLTTAEARKRHFPKTEPSADKLFPILKERFSGYRGEENAKRFRTNAAKAATTAREVLTLISLSTVEIPVAEREFLQQSVIFFDRLNGMFQTAQAGAKRIAAKKEAEYRAKHDAKLREAQVKIFGQQPDPEVVLDVASSLLKFDKAADEWLQKKYSVVRGHVYMLRTYELKRAVEQQDAIKSAREVAEARIDLGERGRRWRDNDGHENYAAGWADYEEFRTNGN